MRIATVSFMTFAKCSGRFYDKNRFSKHLGIVSDAYNCSENYTIEIPEILIFDQPHQQPLNYL